MKILTSLATCTALLGLAACAAPAEEENGTGPDAATINTANDDTVGDASEPPSMETVAMALGEACVGFPTSVRAASCQATDLAQSFECEFALASDPADAPMRSLTLTQSDAAWAVEQEPQFCSSLERANAAADEPASANVPTQPE